MNKELYDLSKSGSATMNQRDNDTLVLKPRTKQKPLEAQARKPSLQLKYSISESLRVLKSESNLDPHESYKIDLRHVPSTFGEGECGEPLKNQHLKLDFTTIEGLDDNICLQEKCIDFWEFISKNRELEKLKVYPIYVNKEDMIKPDFSYSVISLELQESLEIETEGTTSMDWLKQGGLMSQALATAVERSCEVGSGDYSPGWRFYSGSRKPDEPEYQDVCELTPRSAKPQRSPDDIDKLMFDIDLFDLMQPRTLSPPEGPPSIIEVALCQPRPSRFQDTFSVQ